MGLLCISRLLSGMPDVIFCMNPRKSWCEECLSEDTAKIVLLDGAGHPAVYSHIHCGPTELLIARVEEVACRGFAVLPQCREARPKKGRPPRGAVCVVRSCAQ